MLAITLLTDKVAFVHMLNQRTQILIQGMVLGCWRITQNRARHAEKQHSIIFVVVSSVGS
jgi:hypothetical protein